MTWFYRARVKLELYIFFQKPYKEVCEYSLGFINDISHKDVAPAYKRTLHESPILFILQTVVYHTITYVNEEIRFPSITEKIEINANIPDVITLSDCTYIAI